VAVQSAFSGARNLAMLYETGASCRVLNLLKVKNQKAHLREYQEFPLFDNSGLNKCMIVKHHLRPHEREAFPDARMVATKLIWPLDVTNLKTGGYCVYVGEYDYAAKMRQIVGPKLLDGCRDLWVLGLIDNLPSLDPFLLQEHLSKSGVNVSSCYFDTSDHEESLMAEFVSQELRELVQLSVGADANVSTIKDGLAMKIMRLRSDPSVEPLRKILNLTREEFEEGLFSWKGFLYYKWVKSRMNDSLSKVLKELASKKPYGAVTKEGAMWIKKYQYDLCIEVSRAMSEISNTMTIYDDAYNGLVHSGAAEKFRSFLMNAPRLFQRMGGQIGAINHIISFWNFRFHGTSMPETISEDDLLDLLIDFHKSVLLQAAPRHEFS
jgi:predicted CopG family antitoxin